MIPAGRLLLLAAFTAAICLPQSADRRVAEWTLSMGGRVRIAGQTVRIQDISQLPPGDFHIDVLDWVGVNADPPDLERLTGLRHLKELHLPGPLWNRNADGGRDGSREMKHLAGITTLETLTFSFHFLDRIRFRDAGLAEIKTLTGLRELVIRQSDVRGHTLAPFSNLRYFDCTLCPFDDEGMRWIAGMPEMRRLRLGDTAITGGGLVHLRRLERLEELDIHGAPVGDEDIAVLAGLKHLRKLNLMGTGVSDAGMKTIGGLADLEELNLYRTRVSNAGLAHLKGLRKLVEADLRYTRVNTAGVAGLKAARPSLHVLFHRQAESATMTDAELKLLPPGTRSLNLEGSRISDAGLAHLSRLAALEDLNLGGTSVSDAGLAHLAPLAKLRKVNLSNTYVEGPGLKHLAGVEELILDGAPVVNSSIAVIAGLSKVRILSLSATDISDGAPLDLLKQIRSLNLAATDLTDEGLKPLAALSGLEELILRDARFTDKGLAHLAGLKKLRTLDIVRTRISNDGMKHLSGLTSLRSLRLDYGELYDPALDALAPLENLEELTLDNTHITDQAVPKLARLSRLRLLNIYHTLITAEGHKLLKAALPNAKIIFDAASSLPNRRRS